MMAAAWDKGLEMRLKGVLELGLMFVHLLGQLMLGAVGEDSCLEVVEGPQVLLVQEEQSLGYDPVSVVVNCRGTFQLELMEAGMVQAQLAAEEVDTLLVLVEKMGVDNHLGLVGRRAAGTLQSQAVKLEAAGILQARLVPVEFDSHLGLVAKLAVGSYQALVAMKVVGNSLLVEPVAEGNFLPGVGLQVLDNFLLLGAEKMGVHSHRDPVGILLERAEVGRNHLEVL